MSIATAEKLTLNEVAREFGVSLHTVRAWIKRKRNPLKAWKMGGRVWTTRQALDEFAEPQHGDYEFSSVGSFSTAEDAQRNADAVARMKAKYGRA